MRRMFLLSIFTVIILSSCRGKEKTALLDMDKLNLQMADKIVTCINDKDVDRLYELFSKEIMSSDKNLKVDISKLYDYLNGTIDMYEEWTKRSFSKIEKGQNLTRYETKFKLNINNTSYFMYYEYTVKNDFSIDSVGLKLLKIFKESEKDKYFCYWNEIEPGVFLPDEAK